MTNDPKERKGMPIYSGVLKYFPDALLEVSKVSLAGNKQHNPGEPLHWDKSKSTDEGDALVRHLLDAGKIDNDGIRHSAKVAWRALALLQRELDKAKEIIDGFGDDPKKYAFVDNDKIDEMLHEIYGDPDDYVCVDGKFIPKETFTEKELKLQMVTDTLWDAGVFDEDEYTEIMKLVKQALDKNEKEKSN